MAEVRFILFIEHSPWSEQSYISQATSRSNYDAVKSVL